MSSGKGSRRRDFSEFNAKLDKHIDRLPDYAERAQRTVRRFQSYREAGQPPRRRSPGRSAEAGDLPGVAEIRSKWVAWNDPAAKLRRRRARTSRALTLWIVLTLLCGLYAVAGYLGVLNPVGGIEGALGGIAATVVFGALGVRAGLRLRQLNRTELPASAAPAPLPPSGSASHEPMRRLVESEESLEDLLARLAETVSTDSVADARSTAAEAAAALRGLAARMQAIERARGSAPAGERAALDAAIETLAEQLDDGLDEYGSLVASAGRAVAASAGGARPPSEALTDATDRLAGLAIALRELA